MSPTPFHAVPWRAAVLALVAGAVALGTPSVTAAAGKKDPGKRVYMTKGCMACHGKDGRRAIMNYPNLAGQDPLYMVEQMEDIGSGARVGSVDETGHPSTQGMHDIMHLVSPEEMKQVAKWLRAQTPADVQMPDPPLDPSLIETGGQTFKKSGCMACHGPDGKKPLRGYPYIAGQKVAYLVNQMTEIRDKVRTNGKSRLMLGVIRRSSDEDIAAMAAYLSQVQR